jgi:hypothetical protein
MRAPAGTTRDEDAQLVALITTHAQGTAPSS